MTFRLIPIGRDGRPELPLQDLPPDVLEGLKATADFYGEAGFEPPWIGYLALDGDDPVGGGAFVGPPHDGRVEIAYFTRPEHQARGYAGKTAAALIVIARQARPGLAIYAKTAPEAGPSPSILTRLGFERIGSVVDHEIGEAWAWRLG
jgi:[ribosomal protein S5]-alanine N-acetyltransferase